MWLFNQHYDRINNVLERGILMENVNGYLSWRGDLPLKDYLFNEVDDLILARFSYLPFHKIRMNKTETIKNISKKLETFKDEEFSYHGDKEMITKLGLSNRFKDLKVTDFERINIEEKEEQFSAITIELTDKLHYVSFIGTDATTFGWKEDFNLSFMDDIPAQIDAKKYFDKICKKYEGKFILGGHSKGGNIAIYAAINATKRNQDRIIRVTSYDGPGFSKRVVASDKYKRILPKVFKFIPQDSVIGRLLENEEKYEIVYSIEKGIYQHDIYSWQVLGTKLVTEPKTTKSSEVMNDTISKWVEETTPDQRRLFVDNIYDMIVSTEAKTTKELSEIWAKKVGTMIKTYKAISEEDRKTIGKMIKLFITSYFKASEKHSKAQQKIDKTKSMIKEKRKSIERKK
jgi:hypothetical protein